MSDPNYKKMYTDMISVKYPDKLEICSDILKKTKLDTFDVISLQKKVFGTENISVGHLNQRYKSYDKCTILKILAYQKNNNLNNSDLARHFKLSRNTVTRWKKMIL